MTPVIGVDGCPGGWVAIVWSESVELHLRMSFAEVMELAGDIIAVDMPIGLPDRNGRTGDREARARLGDRQSSLFAVPTRAAVMRDDYLAACRENEQRTDPPRKVSRQCFHLFPKIREIDAIMSPPLQRRVYESHPELAFWAMNGSTPLSLPKKVKGSVHPPGLELRRRLLSKAGFPIERLGPWTGRKSEVGPDDILDACACAWVARRILENRHICFPAEPPVDAKGLRMEINA